MDHEVDSDPDSQQDCQHGEVEPKFDDRVLRAVIISLADAMFLAVGQRVNQLLQIKKQV